MNDQPGIGVLLGICFVVVFGIPVWFSLNAGPLGKQPYRWGAYTGIWQLLIFAMLVIGGSQAGFSAQPFAPLALRLASATLAAVLAAAVGSPLAIAGIGLLRRKRYGVVAFFVINGLFWLVGLIRATGDSAEFVSWSIVGIGCFWATGQYFSKRWNSMAPPARITAGPAPTGSVCARCGASVASGAGFGVYSEAVQGLTANGLIFLAIPVEGALEAGDRDIKRSGAMIYCDVCVDVVFGPKVWQDAQAVRIEMNFAAAADTEARDARNEVLDFGIVIAAKRRGLSAAQAREEARASARAGAARAS